MYSLDRSGSQSAVAVPSSQNARIFYRAAKQRFEDAEFLLDVDRTTAAVYLAGYSVECILKALILTTVPRVQENNLLAMFRGARAHDYGWLLRLYAERGGPRSTHRSNRSWTRLPNTKSPIRMQTLRLSPKTLYQFVCGSLIPISTGWIGWIGNRPFGMC